MAPVMTFLIRTPRTITARLNTALLTAVALAAFSPAVAADTTPQSLWDAWGTERFVSTPAPCLRHSELTGHLETLAAHHPKTLRIEEVGHSVEGRSIHLMTLGSGPRTIFLWSQMHGDEPSATPALLDIADYLLSHADDPAAAAILEGTTLLMMPMLNPDGAEVYERRNAQGIDINRDALNLATPEGRLLKRIRDQYQPMLGFNLHDQNRRTAVGDTGVVAANAVLAVAGDEANTLTPGRLRAKRACAAITTALAPFMPERMARYDEDWSPRAFGDNLTAWGTPVVLIESGGLPAGHDISELTRLNFVAILTVLHDLVRDDLAGHDPEIYEALPRNNSNSWTDVAVRGGKVLPPGSHEPYRADLSFDILRADRLAAGCPVGEQISSRIVEVGDNRFISSGREIDATESLILPPFVVGVRGWEARHWLDASVLESLARLGVGRVVWEVDDDSFVAAEEHAAESAAGARARIDVETPVAELPWLTLDAAPPAPIDDSLDATLAALSGGRWREEVERHGLPKALQRLWPDAADGLGRPGFRRGQPASFILAAPLVDDWIDLDTTSLRTVWIDGMEVPPAP